MKRTKTLALPLNELDKAPPLTPPASIREKSATRTRQRPAQNMTSRRIASSEKNLLEKGDRDDRSPDASEKSDIAPAVPA